VKYILHGMGFIADRHVRAVIACGGEVTDCVDIDPSRKEIVPPGATFHEQDEAIRVENWGEDIRPDAAIIATPTDTHIALADAYASQGLLVLVEKPAGAQENTVPRYLAIERAHQGSVSFVLQLRYHPELQMLRKAWLNHGPPANVSFTFHVRRNQQYFQSWKGDRERSGGILFNIGAHAFDTMTWLFGDEFEIVHVSGSDPFLVSGLLRFQDTRVWFSIHADPDARDQVRQISWHYGTLDLTQRFPLLHGAVHKDFMAGAGIGIEDCRAGLELMQAIRGSL